MIHTSAPTRAGHGTMPSAATGQPVRNVLTYGAFDGLTVDHAQWLRRLSRLGSDLIVGCTTDDFCSYLGSPVHTPFKTRRAMLESCRFVSRVIAVDGWEQRWSDIVNHDISILVLPEGARQELEGLDAIVQVLEIPTAWPVPKSDYPRAALTA